MQTPNDFDAPWNTQPLQRHWDGEEAPPAAEEAPPASDDAPPADAPAADAFEDEAVQTFDRKYVTKLREEAAGHRTAAKVFTDAFSGYSEEERSVWLELATGLLNDPAATADRLQQIADRARGVDPGKETPPAGEDDDTPMTKAQMKAFLAEQEQAADLDRRVADIKSAAVELGYKPDSISYRTLLITAQENGGDIAKAHGLLEGEKQAHIDAYVEAQRVAAEGNPTGGGNGRIPAQETKAKTFGEAGDALRAILDARIAT